MPQSSSPIDALARSLAQVPRPPDQPLLIACSGGRDSQVLMHAVAALRPCVPAVVAHVHHGLQAVADEWLDFCAAEAARLGLPFSYRRLSPSWEADRSPLSGLEAWAREWRYRALAEMAAEVGAGIVLTAHHAHDQLETVEIRRRRGSGVLGLAGMRERSPLPFAPAGLLLLRPFLALSRDLLEAWARAQQIPWVDDPANQDGRFTRNRVRQHLAEQLSTGQQSLPAELQAIGLLQQAADQIRRQAADDVLACSLQLTARARRDGPSSVPSTPVVSPAVPVSPMPSVSPEVCADAGHPPSAPTSHVGQLPSATSSHAGPLPILSRAALLRLPAARRAEALRHWLALAGCRMPSRTKLGELERQLVLAAASQAIVRHDGVGFLRYRDRIGRLPALAPISPLLLRWQGERRISLPSGFLHADPVESPAVDTFPAAWLSAQALLLDQGRGRDRWRAHPSAPSRSWKNLMQERGVPPCLRASLPVLRRAGDGVLLFAAPFGASVSALPPDSDTGAGQHPGFIRLRWEPTADIRSWL